MLRIFLSLWLALTPIFAFAGSMTLMGAGKPSAAASSMVTPVLALAAPASLSNSAVNYASGQSSINGSWNSGLGVRAQPMPVAGSFSKLYANFPTATGVGATYDIHLMVNGSASALTCQITNSSTACNDTTHSVSVVAGDTIEWRVTPTSTPAAQTTVQVAALFTSSVAGESFVLSISQGAVSAAATNYIAFGNPLIPNATEVNVSSVVSAAGTIDKLYVILSTAPGASKSYDLTLYKNGSATALTCQVSGAAATTCNDTTHSVSVVAGDLVSIAAIPTGTPSAPTVRLGTKWTPTTPGEAIAFSNASTPPATSATRYGNLSGGSISGGTEANYLNISPSSFTIKNLYVVQDTAPGGGQTRTITVRKGTGGGQSDTAVTCTVATAATSCNDTSNSVSASAADLLNFGTSVSGVNAALTYFKIGVTLYTP